jgi:hypothetical protein
MLDGILMNIKKLVEWPVVASTPAQCGAADNPLTDEQRIARIRCISHQFDNKHRK